MESAIGKPRTSGGRAEEVRGTGKVRVREGGGGVRGREIEDFKEGGVDR